MIARILLPLLLSLLLLTSAQAASLPGMAPLTQGFTKKLIIEELTRAGRNDRFDVQIHEPALPMGNQSRDATDIVLDDLRFDVVTGRFQGTLLGRIGANPRFSLPLEGEITSLVDIAVLAVPIGRGEPIAAGDLDWIAVAPNKLPHGAIIEPDDLIGSEARRRLTPGRVLTGKDVRAPRLVYRGQPVRVIYVNGDLRLTALGTARDDAAIGQIVRVLNPESRLQVQGIATGPAEVTVGGAVRHGAGS